MLEQLNTLAAIVATGLSFLGLLWGISSKLINQHHKRAEKLEIQKIDLQKELEQTRQRHVQKLIDAIRQDIATLVQKVDELRKAYFSLDKKIAANESRTEAVLNSMKEFTQDTNRRFVAVEKQVETLEKEVHAVDTKVDSQMEKIGKDLYIIREAARKVKKSE